MFRLSRGVASVAGGFWTKFKEQLAQPRLVLESCNFGYKPNLSQLGVPYTQNFEILLKTQESRKFEISFEIFKNARWLKIWNKMSLGNLYSDIFQIWKILKFL
jgi:hypothetical protein